MSQLCSATVVEPAVDPAVQCTQQISMQACPRQEKGDLSPMMDKVNNLLSDRYGEIGQ